MVTGLQGHSSEATWQMSGAPLRSAAAAAKARLRANPLSHIRLPKDMQVDICLLATNSPLHLPHKDQNDATTCIGTAGALTAIVRQTIFSFEQTSWYGPRIPIIVTCE